MLLRRPSAATASCVAPTVMVVLGIAGASDAHACGGVFVQAVELPASRDIVRDHRMAIAIGRDETIVWDEVRLQGSPRDFVWVTPVKPGTTIELASGEWMQALDASTQPVVYGPLDGRGGCAVGGCAQNADTGESYDDGVVVLNERALGPYTSVTLRAATDPDAPFRWFKDNGFAVPDRVAPVLRTYAREGFDFIALRLDGSCSGTAMRPVRIRIPGAEPRILLRMALAGAQAHVPLTVFVVAEAPYRPRPSSYASATIDDDALLFERPGTYRSTGTSSSRSNYEELAGAAMAESQDATFLVESSAKADMTSAATYRGATPGLYEAYLSLCRGGLPRGASSSAPSGSASASPCPQAPGPGGVDAGEDAGGDGGPFEDAGVPIDPAETSGPRCTGKNDDFDVAARVVGAARDVYVTRLRGNLSAARVERDLDLEPRDIGVEVGNLHQALRYGDRSEEPDRKACATTRGRRRASPAAPLFAIAVSVAVLAAAGLRRALRRR